MWDQAAVEKIEIAVFVEEPLFLLKGEETKKQKKQKKKKKEKRKRQGKRYRIEQDIDDWKQTK